MSPSRRPSWRPALRTLHYTMSNETPHLTQLTTESVTPAARWSAHSATGSAKKLKTRDPSSPSWAGVEQKYSM
ncbi:hypothetical protein RRG08_051118 [Elysia crispata]|nr:hypothetical protein RRG08_051118 [Elysia crispata]